MSHTPMSHTDSELEYFEVARRLPCGHMMRQVMSFGPDSSPVSDEVIDTSMKVAHFQFHDRARRHRCELVSADNPYGIPRKYT